MSETTHWLLTSSEPWTRYRTLLDLLDRPADDPEVRAARADMLAHPQIEALVAHATTWGTSPLQRHNDAGHAIYALSTLADFGLQADDPGIAPAVDAFLAHQAPEGAFQTLINIPRNFGGSGEDAWTWIVCDAPTVLYILLGLGVGTDTRIQRAVNHLISLVDDNGWRCVGSPDIGKFRGPGRKDDPCPIANVYALKAIAAAAAHGRPDLLDGSAARAGAEMLLSHWEQQGERKMYLFGIGTDFRKLKYPFVWYDILHVTGVLSRFPFLHDDPRFREMVETIAAQADTEGRYTATSMYKAWKGWSFADKKNPSPWLTFLALRIMKQSGRQF
ncbi:MAG: hypothetical protein JXA93_24150 [Anaerolineae bacterium]|nr:hypothetical protein [Anaerolineae bacterium]